MIGYFSIRTKLHFLILELFRYRQCALDERTILEKHARQVTRISSRPVYVLRELVDLLRRERVALPRQCTFPQLRRRFGRR